MRQAGVKPNWFRPFTFILMKVLKLLKILKELEGIELKIFWDGCGGQNENHHINQTLMYWLPCIKFKIQSNTIIFPVRGDSFLPAERKFVRMKKIFKKEPLI